uniref:DUF4426 domain-containing protein n=1 Tax=Thaumasiovibrio occultus TaxID=1891184 RepID=UPI000B35C90A|nr:DUF4426 domain-containing protein [Thaumasiovibrio occultus]
MKKQIVTGIFSLFFGFLSFSFSSFSAYAEQAVRFDNLAVHYSAIPTTFLSPEVATQYQIQRSRYAALLNISVLDQNKDNQAVMASITGHAKNLLGNRFPLEFRQVKEGSAIYYLAEIKHTHEDKLQFEIQVLTAGGTTNTLTFEQTFYTD